MTIHAPKRRPAAGTNPFRIACAGLAPRERRTIENLLRRHPGLRGRHVFATPAAHAAVDVLFVDGDDAGALAEWSRQHRRNPALLAIVVASSDVASCAVAVLRRPLQARDVISILDALGADEAPLPDAAPEDVLRVLVVDSSDLARAALVRQLEAVAARAGVAASVEGVASGAAAVSAAMAQACDLVFLDALTAGDGEVCRRLRALGPLRIVMIDAASVVPRTGKDRQTGCDNHLTRPAGEADLRIILRLTDLQKCLGQDGALHPPQKPLQV